MTVGRSAGWRVVGVAAAALLAMLAAGNAAGPLKSGALDRAKSWHFQLQNIDLGVLRANAADLLVIDNSVSDAPREGVRWMSADEVTSLKTTPDGRRRPVIAYLSVGEAEDYRHYWQPSWNETPPSWRLVENCRWTGNYLVRFWTPEWQEVLYRGRKSVLSQLQDAGFDGVYLDRVDAYSELVSERDDARSRMIDLVRALADEARRRQPGFLIIAQNGEDLLRDKRYRDTIDAIAKESLLSGLSAPGVRNTRQQINWSLERLKLMQRDGKPVFTVEYPAASGAGSRLAAEHRALRFVPQIAPRALDGSVATAAELPELVRARTSVNLAAATCPHP
jgi:cysteinyl-tRNA synthetase